MFGIEDQLAMVFVLWDSGQNKKAIDVINRAIRLLDRKDKRLAAMQRKIDRMHQMLGEQIEKDGYRRYLQIKKLMDTPNEEPKPFTQVTGMIIRTYDPQLCRIVQKMWDGAKWIEATDADGNWTEEAAAVSRKVRGEA